ncbi:MAG: family 16 glycoside hydrolase [Planctomycetota bacterium]
MNHLLIVCLLGCALAIVDGSDSESTSWREKKGATAPSPLLLTETQRPYFREHFHLGQLSERLWYSADWKAEQGVLKRLEHGSGPTRIFLRDANYKDTVIRFDFRLRGAQDVRLMTGSDGHYNTVLHVRPNQFFLQTAQDSSVPYFSYRHGECAYEFKPDRWYTMTIEFLGDEAVAHLDHRHLVRAKHPMIDRTRDYFAIQVDDNPAEFDNVEILTAVPRKSGSGRATIESAEGKFPVAKPLREMLVIRRKNAHEWYYQRDAASRRLVKRVDELDRQKKRQFPNAFRTQKEFKKEIQAERRRLNETDRTYRDLLTATHRANRSIEQWLISQRPEVEQVNGSRRKAFVAELHREMANEPELLMLVEAETQAQARLKAAYPQLFVSDQTIQEQRRAAAAQCRQDPVFQRLTRERADAYRAQRDYLLANDDQLNQLDQQVRDLEL